MIRRHNSSALDVTHSKLKYLLAVLLLEGASCVPVAVPVIRIDSPLNDLTRVQDGRSRRVSSAAPEAWSNRDNTWIKPGETRVLADIAGPGIIRHIWLTFSEARPNWLSAAGSANPSEMVLRMYWDDAEQPAVETPLGDFFAAGFGKRFEVNSVPVQVQEGDAYNCFWPMPFHRRGRVTLTNESDKNISALYYHIDYEERPWLPADTAFFCAQYRQEFPQQTGRDYLIADIEGRGHYVGTVLSVRARSPEWFGEGDDKFYVDGEEIGGSATTRATAGGAPAATGSSATETEAGTKPAATTQPAIWGTGTEDYVLCAWGLSPCTFPYFGAPYVEGAWGDVGWQMSAYRWHIADPVRFQRSLRVEIEHKGWMSADETASGKVEGHVEREDDMATVAFWYQVGQPKRFATLPPARERAFPNLDLIVEGKALKETVRHSTGDVSLQRGYDWTGEGQLFFVPREGDGTEAARGEPRPPGQEPRSPEAWMEFDFNVEKEELRRLMLRMTHSYDYGEFRVLLDGKVAIERLDLYKRDIEVHDHSLGDHRLAVGRHKIRVECVGQNSNSTGRRLGVDSVRLRERWQKKRAAMGP